MSEGCISKGTECGGGSVPRAERCGSEHPSHPDQCPRKHQTWSGLPAWEWLSSKCTLALMQNLQPGRYSSRNLCPWVHETHHESLDLHSDGQVRYLILLLQLLASALVPITPPCPSIRILSSRLPALRGGRRLLGSYLLCFLNVCCCYTGCCPVPRDKCPSSRKYDRHPRRSADRKQ